MKKIRVSKSAASAIHKAHHPAHLAYFAMVAVEAGHWYGLAAAVLFLLTLVDGLIEGRPLSVAALEAAEGEGD